MAPGAIAGKPISLEMSQPVQSSRHAQTELEKTFATNWELLHLTFRSQTISVGIQLKLNEEGNSDQPNPKLHNEAHWQSEMRLLVAQ